MWLFPLEVLIYPILDLTFVHGVIILNSMICYSFQFAGLDLARPLYIKKSIKTLSRKFIFSFSRMREIFLFLGTSDCKPSPNEGEASRECCVCRGRWGGVGWVVLWPLHLFEIVLLRMRFSRKFTFASLNKVSKIFLALHFYIFVKAPDKRSRLK